MVCLQIMFCSGACFKVLGPTRRPTRGYFFVFFFMLPSLLYVAVDGVTTAFLLCTYRQRTTVVRARYGFPNTTLQLERIDSTEEAAVTPARG